MDRIIGQVIRSSTRIVAGLVAALLVVGTLVLAPSAAGAAAFDSRLTRAPYLTDLVGLHVNVNWATDRSQTTGSVQWGPVTSGTCSLTNTQNANRVSITVGSVLEYQWTAPLTLPSQGTYCYRPFLTTTDLLATNPSPQFRTQVPAGDATPYSFAVFGDWGLTTASGNADQAHLHSQIAASGVRFAVSVGDNGYPNGSQLNYGDLQQTGADTSAIFGPSFWTVPGKTVPLFSGVGNHGLSGPAHTDITTWTQDTAVASSGGRYQNDVYCCVNGSSSANYGSEWYAFDAGPARFYVLDSAWGDTNGGSATPYANDAAAHFAPGTPQYQWLLNDLQTHPGGIKFAFSHYPWYSDNSSQNSDTFLQGASKLEGLLAQNGVKIAFQGHAHIYQRNTPSAAGMPATYITGGGGATLEPIDQCKPLDAYGLGWSPTNNKGTKCGSAPVPNSASKVFHFLKVTVSGTTVTVAPTDSNGSTFDVQTYNYPSAIDTIIDSAPTSVTKSTSATLAFHATTSGATFKCSLDGATPTTCTSPVTYPGPLAGSHTFSVAATAAGVTDATPATASWTVDSAPPSVPGNVVANAASATSVTVSWNASTDTSGVTGYDVARNGVTIGSVNGTTTSYTDSTVAPATSYQYTVDARDGAGNVSSFSAPPAGVTTPAGAGLVQSAGSSTNTVALGAPSTAGNLLVLSAGVFTGLSKPITAVSDGKNTWTKIGAYAVSGANSDGEMWYAANAQSVSSVTVTTGATAVALKVQEFSGVKPTSPLDGSAGSANTGTAASSGSASPTTANDLAVGFIAGHANSQAITITSPGYLTQTQQTTTSPSIATVVTGYQNLGAPAPQSLGGSFPAAMYWSAGVAFFKTAGVPPPPDFSISAAPTTVTVTAGQSGTSTISTAITSGAAQSVALSATGLPSGATASFNPATITAGQSSTMTITTTAATPTGTVSFSVTGTGTSATHSTPVSLTVNAPPDFSISAAPTTVTVTAGQSGTSTISTAITSGAAQSVALSVSGLPSGATASFNPATITSGQSSTLTITTTTATPTGTVTVTVTGTGASATHATPISLTVNPVPDDFSISAAPTTVTVTAGQSGTSTISTAITSGNAQSVTLSVSGLPSGATASFNPASITSGQSSTLTITTTAATPTGTVTVTLTGTGASATHATPISLTVNPVPDDFSISAAPTTVTVTAGQSGTSTISTAITSGNAQSVTLSASGLPSGASASFNPASITSGQSSTMTITTTAATPTGTVSFSVTGTGTSTTQSTPVSLTVNPVPDDFSISAAPTTVAVSAGQSGTSTISTAVTTGNAQSVTLSASGLPSGASASFNPATITSGQSSTLTITTTAATPTGTVTVTVTGTGTSTTQSTPVSLTVNPAVDDFSISAAPTTVTVTAGQSGTSTISTAVTTGNAQSVTLSASGLPSGATASFNPATITSGQSSTLTITTTAATPTGTVSFSVTGTGTSTTQSTPVSLTVNAPVVDDFSISAAPTTITVTAGQSGTSTISTAVTSGNAQSVTLSASGLPSGATASFNPTTITSGQSSTLTIATTAATPTGTVTVTVTGTGSSTTQSTPVSLTVNPVVVDDFSISAAPSTVTVTAGQSGTSTISTAVTTGNAQSVTLSASGLPSGATASFNPATITSGQSSTLTITTTAATPTGTVSFSVTGTGTSTTQSTPVSLTVNPVVVDDFSISAAPTTITVTAGQSGTSTISTAVTTGNAQSVTLSASGLPSGASASFNPATINSGQSSTLTISTTGATPTGTVTVTVTGTGASATHTATFSLTVNAPDDFSISAAPTTITVTAGQSGTSTISTAVTSGNAQSVTLSASGLPSGASASFNPASVAAGQSSTLTITTTAATPTGTVSFSVTGAGASATHSTPVSLTVNAPVVNDFSISAAPTTVTVTAGQSGTSTISTAVTSGVAQSVTLSASGLPSGASASFNPATITSGQSSTMTITTTAATPTGTVSFSVTATGASATHSTPVSLTVNPIATVTPTLVRSTGATETASATSLTATFPAATTTGDLLVVSASVYTGTTNHITAVTDSAGNTWTRIGAYSVASHNSDGEMWYSPNAASVTTVTVKTASAATVAFAVQEFAGVATAGTLDVSTGTSNTSTAASSGAVTPTVGNALVVGFVAGHANAQAISVTSPGFTAQSQLTSTGTIASVITAYRVLATPSAQTMTGSFGTAMYWAAGVAVFKPGS